MSLFFSHEEKRLLEKILLAMERAELVQHLILRELCPHHVIHFHIKETFMLPIAPGNSPVFTATPQPAGATIDPNQAVPVWTSSDTTNAPVTADETGLIATVAIPESAVVGTSFTLTITYTNADGSTATGTTSQTIVAAEGGTGGGGTVTPITAFSIDQTA